MWWGFICCKEQGEGIEPPGFLGNRVSLQAEAGVVEAWLTLRVEDLPSGVEQLHFAAME